MKKIILLLILIICLASSIIIVSFGEELKSINPKFVTIQEWIDAEGECGDCMLLLKIQTILNPVLAVAADETGTINLFSANGEDSMIVNFMGDEGLTEGSMLVIANPKWNEYEDTIEMAEWSVLRMMPVLFTAIEE